MFDVDYIEAYLEYFFKEIIGFEKTNNKYMQLKNNEYLSIAMDKIDRLTRKNGRLRTRVWSNFYFIFHDGDLDPKSEYKQKVNEVKKQYPFLFIRSYVYFVFIDLSSVTQRDIFNQSQVTPKTKHFKIWAFNSKYEVKEETRRSNLLGITLSKDEIVDDYIYLANPELELNRMESSNSDAVDCVKAFTGDLALLQQTSDMLEKVREDYREEQSRVIVEGPARSGKTIIAASLLGEFKNAKFLLMNYFFYQAIVDGFHALSGWDEEEINKLVKNDELDLWLYLEKTIPHKLNAIRENLRYAIKDYGKEKSDSKTKKWLIENIDELAEACESVEFDTRDLKVFNSLKNLNKKLKEQGNNSSFSNVSFDALRQLHGFICGITSNKSSTLVTITENISKVIKNLIENSEQKFFHHNINSKISSKVIEGCWIVRGNPTKAKLWTDDHKPELIICDEVQRLGVIGKYGNYDEFDETAAIIDNSKHTFFTGDNFQMLNQKYDKGIEKIEECLHGKGESLKKHRLPDSVGVPPEIGMLMKYLTNPESVVFDDVLEVWLEPRQFELVLINDNTDTLISLFDSDNSHKKHIASPLDSAWTNFNDDYVIKTKHRENDIIELNNHEKEHFAYKFPYFCNEEIMPNYILSAYELISREVESLYVNIPNFNKLKGEDKQWFNNHLYVLFSRPTSRLVVNFKCINQFSSIKDLIDRLSNHGAMLPVDYR